MKKIYSKKADKKVAFSVYEDEDKFHVKLCGISEDVTLETFETLQAAIEDLEAKIRKYRVSCLLYYSCKFTTFIPVLPFAICALVFHGIEYGFKKLKQLTAKPIEWHSKKFKL